MQKTPYIVREYRPEFDEYQCDRTLWKIWFRIEGPGKPSWLLFRDRIKEEQKRLLDD